MFTLGVFLDVLRTFWEDRRRPIASGYDIPCDILTADHFRGQFICFNSEGACRMKECKKGVRSAG